MHCNSKCKTYILFQYQYANTNVQSQCKYQCLNQNNTKPSHKTAFKVRKADDLLIVNDK